jgi:pimeloyl-ACP methyl ester carboxylesterase
VSGIYKSEAGRAAVEARYREFLSRWPVPNTQFSVKTREGDTFIIACGPETAPAVLLFHGSGANATAWLADIAAWSASFRTYAIDMIGEPGLSAPSRPPLGSDACALWLDDVMAALSLAHVSIVGVSLGGWLALDYATRRPERVEKLALICPAGIGRQKNFLFKALPLMLLGQWGNRKVREMVFGPAPEQMSAGQSRMRDFMALIFRHFRPRIVKIPLFSDDALKRLTMPVLAIVGGKDVMLNSEGTCKRFARSVPHADVRYLPDARHYIAGQTQTILEFLQGVKAPTAMREAAHSRPRRAPAGSSGRNLPGHAHHADR